MAFIPQYILILFFTIIVDYIAGILIEKAREKKRKLLLWVSIVTNVGVLCLFKYYNFFIENVNNVFAIVNIHTHPLPILRYILPLGLSFHTFQAMSYTIEVYRGNQKAERHLGIYSLYVMFYPQLVAGPIERPQNLLHQFKEKHRYNYDNVTSGLRLMLWGMFKKIVIADKLALFVDPVFTTPSSYPALTLLIAVIFFTFEIYCDFSGYSDIAIGAGKVMGFTLMRNFNRPYCSTSVSDFWKRWHISLSTWFRDYLYISIGGNRVPVKRWYFNLLVVFLISGFWHGANWTFVMWGALHGFYLIFALTTENYRKKCSDTIGLNKINWLDSLILAIITFTLVAFAWIFFRAKNISDAFYIIHRLPHALKDIKLWACTCNFQLGSGIVMDRFLTSWILIVLLLMIEIVQERTNLFESLKKHMYIRWLEYYALVTAIILFGEFSNRTFIYFQF